MPSRPTAGGPPGRGEGHSNALRVLAVSHSCVVGLNQQRYEALGRFADLDLTLVFPTHYVSDFDGRRLDPDKTAADAYRIVCGPPAFAGNGSLYFYLGGLRRAFQASQPQVVFLDEEPWSLCAAQVVMAAWRRRARIVFFSNQNLRKVLPPPFHAIQRLVFRLSRWAFVPGEEAAETLRWKGYTGPISLLPYGVDAALFRPRDRSELRRRLALDALVFAYVGRLVPEKGVDVFVEAGCQLCRDAAEKVQFLIVGSGPEQDKLHRIAQRSGYGHRFTFVLKVAHAEVPVYLSAADVVVVPSLTTRRWKEQFGRIITEALACGVPVIGSDSGEIPHLIRRLGGGLIVREGEPDDLSRAMGSLLYDPALRKVLAEAGRKAVLAHYTHETVAAMLRNVFLKVAGSERR